jgi:sugar lactone lactonase YvrE
MALDAATGATRYWVADEMVACVAPRSDGGLIAGMETGIFALELDACTALAQRKLAAPASGLGEGMRFNDGRCDRQGRFWSGTMFMDMARRALSASYTVMTRSAACPRHSYRNC